ncbi:MULTISPECIES: YqhV family protein [unclassified Candidatus Frackibacter]|uniref:YqhV family protein n=1 Tax=unclassified Candidatus Frackibacter TaxID=2648818 RepID=UPI00079CA94A|nr:MULTISPECIES: YqhV family protein [unclassified Candidatus Frackibacter]KXS40586.1 MAG: hypothetical protein AWU54_1916 [Candidatus Frackibacter sp. T328-2]SDC61542.1 Protein of unknown function [Candidatus Frackibacter sp. WG11]SEM75343.1 Protein of unknown function [Candidatus Frackibacter sp. WG12]SFL86893.1 Protein of unknown function [Candidatus Frackibacter sp. WG13]
MIFIKNKIVSSMALLRIISGVIEFTAALLMLKFNSVERAMQLNSVLAIVGPTVLVLVTTLGLIGIADKISILNFIIIGSGVALILLGIKI